MIRVRRTPGRVSKEGTRENTPIELQPRGQERDGLVLRIHVGGVSGRTGRREGAGSDDQQDQERAATEHLRFLVDDGGPVRLAEQ